MTKNSWHTFLNILWSLLSSHKILPQGVSKDENERKKSRPVPPVFLYLSRLFSYLRKIWKWDRRREGVYPARICGIPFLAGIIPYYFHIYKIWKKIIGTSYILSCSSILIYVLHDLIIGNKKHWSYIWKITCVKECLVLYSCK